MSIRVLTSKDCRHYSHDQGDCREHHDNRWVGAKRQQAKVMCIGACSIRQDYGSVFQRGLACAIVIEIEGTGEESSSGKNWSTYHGATSTLSLVIVGQTITTISFRSRSGEIWGNEPHPAAGILDSVFAWVCDGAVPI